MNCSKDGGYRQRRLGREKIGKREGLIQKIGCRDNVIDKAETCRFRGIKGASGQYQFYGAFRPALRGRRCVPPNVGMMPMLISALLKAAVSAASAM